jgi:hypothetical protein
MSRIHLQRFLGIAPKISETVLANEQAQIAQNVRLWSQALSPLHGLALGVVLAKDAVEIKTLHRYDENTVWLAWTQHVHATAGPAKNDVLEKLYFSGTDKPRVTTNALYDDGAPGTSIPPASWVLGIPAPVGPPVATDVGAGNVVVTSGTWVYTFVRKYTDGWVEESAPSPVSNALTLASRAADVTVPSGALTVADYGITHKRLYRTNGTEYFFVAEVAVASTTAADNVATANLGDAIDTIDDLPWPDGLFSLISLPNGCMAGAMDNVVYISEPQKPHATRLLNQYTVNAPIVGLGSVGTTIVVITTKKPELGRGVDPAAYSFKANSGLFPCMSARSIASSELGVFWATSRGMALSDGVGVVIATDEFISRKEWEDDFYPDNIHGVVHEGRYYGWFDTGVDPDGYKVGRGFILDKLEAAFLSTLSEYVYAAHTIPESDTLHVVRKNPSAQHKNYTYQWDADPSAPLAYEWKSKVFVTAGLDNLGAAQIIADYGDGLTPAEVETLLAQTAIVQAFNNAIANTDGPINGNAEGFAINGGALNGDNFTVLAPDAGFVSSIVTFKYWVDGELVLVRDVDSKEPFPLPSGKLGELHEFSVSGQVEIDQITLAGAPDELGMV